MKENTFFIRACWTRKALRRAEEEVNRYFEKGWEPTGIELRREWFRWVLIACFSQPKRCDCDCDACMEMMAGNKNCACDCCLAHYDPNLVPVEEDEDDEEEEEFT